MKMRRLVAEWPWAVLASCFVLAGLASCGCKDKGAAGREGARAGEAGETEEAEVVEETENADEDEKAEDDEKDDDVGVSDFIDYAIGKTPIERGERMKKQIRDAAAKRNKQFEDVMNE